MKNDSRGLDELQSVVDRLDASIRPVAPPEHLESAILDALPGRRLRGPWSLAALVGSLVLAVALGALIPWRDSQPSAAGMNVALLTPPSGKAFGTLVLDPDDGKGILAVRDLPGTATYRLWVVRDSAWTSLGTFASDAEGSGSLSLAVSGTLAPGVSFCVSADEGDTYHPDSWVLKGSL